MSTTNQYDEDLDEKQEALLIEFETRVDLYSKYISYLKFSTMFFFFSFLIILTINLSLANQNLWFMVSIFLILSLLSFNLIVNFSLLIQKNVENLEGGKTNIGTIFSLISTNLITICLTLYFTLLSLRLHSVITIELNLISIALYLIFVNCLFYFVFILPALIKAKLYFEVVLILSYIVNIFSFILSINSLLDSGTLFQGINSRFIPIWIAITIHILYNIYYIVFEKESFISFVSCFINLISVFMITVMISMKVDLNYNIPNWTYGVVLILSFQIYAIDKFYFVKEDNEENNQIKGENEEEKKLVNFV